LSIGWVQVMDPLVMNSSAIYIYGVTKLSLGAD
jgi:hypothetical protein